MASAGPLDGQEPFDQGLWIGYGQLKRRRLLFGDIQRRAQIMNQIGEQGPTLGNAAGGGSLEVLALYKALLLLGQFRMRDQLKFYEYDVAIIDWRMPGREGIDVVEWARRHRRPTLGPRVLLRADDGVRRYPRA